MRLVCFRFFIIYVLLALVPWTWSSIVPWVAGDLLALERPPFRGSGDTTWNYVHIGVDVLVAAIGATVWSALRVGERVTSPLLALLVRAYLFKGMTIYGLMKVFGTQFPAPSLVKLTTTFGESTPMGVLWAFMGASQPYCVFTGVVELAGGLLLLSRRTTTLGAMVVLAAMTNVFALNLCYDVPVKQHALHQLVAAAFLVARDGKRLVSLLVLGRAAEARPLDDLITQPRVRRIGHVAKWALAATFLLSSTANVSRMRSRFFATDPPALHGILVARAPNAPWSQLVLARRGRASLQLRDGPRHPYRYALDEDQRTITLEPREDDSESVEVSYEQPSPQRLIITVGDERFDFQRFDADQYPLRRHGFHLVSQQPSHRWR